ncbi:sensor histidine kinase YesM [Paenibacillus sp. J31TS4]|uniref:cache domain-containing sensor histidine kinase n=1 Tax=Paenibacillus sp. J31TS4 TaxID=2807195 RepID=UPI001B196914|nr:sensor histidine kinase [Paenibacillus sp. J31TS4]GIP37681.1 sensor histidine kinase YesM [Paenibacillus sp. J31TS4]
MARLIRWLTGRFTGNIQLRLTCYFLLILLPLVVVSLFANVRSQQVLLEQTTDRTKGALASSMDYIDLILQNAEETSTMIATDSNLIRLLSESDKELTPQAVVNFSEVLRQLANVASINHMFSQISIYHAKSGMLVSTGYGGRNVPQPELRDWLKRAAKQAGTGLVYKLPGDPVKVGETFGELVGADGVSLVRPMDLYNRERGDDVLILTMNQAKLKSLIRSLLPSEQASIELVMQDGRQVAGTAASKDEAPAAGAEPDDRMTIQVDSKEYKWSLRMVQPKAELYGETDRMRNYTYIIIAVSVLLALWISWTVYSNIASPLQKLSYAMKRLGGGFFGVRLESTRKDEFGYLMNAFNQMAEEQKHLIEGFYEQQLRLAQTELKFLQSQINPHFLYNTLDSIYWTAKNYEADEISEMVLNLSRFFRLSLNKGRDAFTVEETVSHLQYYVRVQQLRFLDSFEASYSIADDAKGVPVLKLLLQPLVENAILHGLENKQSDGRLRIGAEIAGGYLQLTVRDNGSGIPEDRLAHIRRELARLRGNGTKRLSFMEEEIKDLYGMRNVLSRMLMFYGTNAELLLESTEGSGTTVTVRLPLDRCVNEFRFEQPGDVRVIEEDTAS